jgi:hypothetical protein
MTSVGERFAAAVAIKDRDAVRGMLAPDVDFKGLTPGRFWEAADPDGVLSVLFDTWFADDDRIDALTAVENGDDVGDVQRIGYRFDLSTSGGPHTVEQQAYYRESAGQIVYMRVVCSGFRPRSG